MSITRNNYEEYFILYMDNELSREERRMVEAFVQQHPDLKEELDNLLQYKLIPDTGIVFEGKEELLKKNGHSLITLNNYEEWVSLYIDNELTIEQKQLVDTFIAANPLAKKEFDILQKIKLQPVQVVFPDKESLYRREEPVKRMPVRWWRASAAVLILALGLTSILIFNKKQKPGKDDVATAAPAEQTQSLKSDSPQVPEKDNSRPMASEEKNTMVAIPFASENNSGVKTPPLYKENNKAVADNKKVVPPDNNLPENNPDVIKTQEPVVAENKPSNNLPQPLNNPDGVSNNKPKDAVANNKPDETNPVSISANPVVTYKAAQPSNIIPASYNENNNDAIFDQPDGKKNKNRGIFRKIARTFEKRTSIDPTDNNKLLVAGLAIKLK